MRRAALRRAAGAVRCRRKFLRFFPGGFRDETYLEWVIDLQSFVWVQGSDEYEE